MTRAQRRIARVKEDVSIVDLMIGYGYPIHKGGREEQFPCDLHGDGRDSKPSGRVYPESNTFYCFACGKTRDTIELVREKEGLDFWASIRALEERFNLEPLPWDDDRPGVDQASRGLQSIFDQTQPTFADDLKRLTTLLNTATRERQIPLSELLAFWEARDKLDWRVEHKIISESSARQAANVLRERLRGLIDHSIEKRR